MKKILIILFIFFLGCSSNLDLESENNLSQDNVNTSFNQTIIVAFGDSLTEGYGIPREDAYPNQLENELTNLGYNVKVYNSGYSGETTTGALNRVDWVLSLNPDIVILTTGANDAIRGIDLSITKQNIQDIISKFKEKNVTIILSGMKIYENLGQKYIQEFEDIYPSLAQENDLAFIELFLAGVEANPELNIEDQIHPNKEGYEIIVEKNILPVLIPILNS